MGKPEDADEPWNQAERDWLDSLPIQDVADLFWMAENGPDDEKDEETLEMLREGYREATGGK